MLGWVIRLLLLALLLRLITGFIRSLSGRRGGRQVRAPKPRSLVKDPVCGTYVEPSHELSTRSGDTVHYFCSETCRRSFRQTA